MKQPQTIARFCDEVLRSRAVAQYLKYKNIELLPLPTYPMFSTFSRDFIRAIQAVAVSHCFVEGTPNEVAGSGRARPSAAACAKRGHTGRV